MVLTYPGALPEGALVRLHRHDTEPLWLDASAGLTLSEAGRVIGWQAKAHSAKALPVAANAQGTARTENALHFAAGESGGLVLSGVVPDLSTLTFAAILSPNLPEARTVLSLQAEGAEDYIFLSLDGTRLRLAQRGGSGDLSLAVPEDATLPLLITCSLSKGEARLAVNGGKVVSAPLAILPAKADLFIGCRNGKGGMKNKLGSFDLTDVLLWPGQDLLRGALPSTLTQLWQERGRLDL